MEEMNLISNKNNAIQRKLESKIWFYKLNQDIKVNTFLCKFTKVDENFRLCVT